MSKKRLYISIFVILILIGGIISGVYFYLKVKQPSIDAMETIPNNAAIVLRLNKTLAAWDELKKEGGILSKLNLQGKMLNFVSETDSLLIEIQKYPSLKNFIIQNPAFISIHFSGSENFDVLYTFSLNPPYESSEIGEDLKKLGSISERKFNGKTIFCITLKNQQKLFYSFISGVFSISKSDLLIEKVILNIEKKEKNSAESELTKALLKMSAKDATANIYIDYKYGYKLIAKYANADLIDMISKIGSVGEKTSLDVAISEEYLMMNGFSYSYDSIPSLLNALKTQKPQKITSTEIMPSDVCFFAALSFNNFSDLSEALIQNNFGLSNPSKLDEIRKNTGINISDFFQEWIHSEMALCVSKSTFENVNNASYCLLKTTDIKEAESRLNELSLLFSKSQNKNIDTMVYRDFIMHNMQSRDVISSLFGTAFNPIQSTYYTSIQDFIVFANSYESLSNFINSFLLENTLSRNENYSAFAENLSEKANFYLYSDLSQSIPLLKYFVNPEISSKLESGEFALENFDGFAIQFVCESEGDFTNVLLHYKNDEVSKNSFTWQLALDDEVYGDVYQFSSTKGDFNTILAFDKQKNMYQIDNDGKISWKIPMAEFPIGKVFLVDYYKNGKYQYLFNSANYLYLMDTDGNRVGNFPMKLPKIALSGIQVIDLDNNLDYRIMLLFEDKKLHCLGLDGKEKRNWINPSISTGAFDNIKQIKLGNEEFLILSDTLGNVQFLNRKGELKNQAGNFFTKNYNSDFFLGTIQGKALILTSDKIGRLIKINQGGKVEKTNLVENVNGNHKLFFSDLNHDNIKDIIILSSNKIQAFNDKGERLLQFEFENEVQINKFSFLNNPSKDGIYMLVQEVLSNKILKIKEINGSSEIETFNNHQNFYFKQATLSSEMHLITVNGRVLSKIVIK